MPCTALADFALGADNNKRITWTVNLAFASLRNVFRSDTGFTSSRSRVQSRKHELFFYSVYLLNVGWMRAGVKGFSDQHRYWLERVIDKAFGLCLQPSCQAVGLHAGSYIIMHEKNDLCPLLLAS